jgi:hypothetical protein
MTTTMDDLRINTEQFVRTTVAGWSKKPSEESILKAIDKIVRAFRPVISKGLDHGNHHKINL